MSEHDNELRPTRKGPDRINRLTMREQFELIAYVKEHYAVSRLTDAQFAVEAGAELRRALTAANILGARGAFDIPSNQMVLREERKRPTNRLEAIEASVLALNVRVQTLERMVHHLTNSRT